MTDRADPLAALAALVEPMRRRLYLLLAAERHPMSRDAAASALGVSRSTAAFHLDKLAQLGLLEVEYRRPPGRSGPGAGRPAKLYRRAAREVTFCAPPRHYDVAASLLAESLERADSGSATPAEASRAVAREYGRSIGVELLSADRTSPEELPGQLMAALASYGYEPQAAGDVVTLENCPFHILAEDHRDLICGMNYELIAGMLDAVGVPETVVRLDPEAGRCCVTLRTG